VAEDHQRPLPSQIKRNQGRERADDSTADVSAAAEVGDIEADRARDREDDAPPDRDQADAGQGEQPAPREIANRRQRGERDEQRPRDKQDRRDRQDQDLECE
jgi:hypothetical protein